MKYTLPVAALAATLALGACAASTATSSGTGNHNQTDVDSVTAAWSIIHFDQEEGKLAASSSKNAEVLAAAQSMTNAANFFESKLGPASAAAGITLPTALPTDLRIRLGHMTIQQGNEFDRYYVNDQLYSHENNLGALEEEAAHGQNPELIAIAKQGIPVVQKDIAHLRELQRRMPMDQPA